MSIKLSLIKFIIKLTPNIAIIWVANFVLKGIAELLEFNFDVDARKVYVQTRLYGEEGTIEVSLEDFAIFNDGESYRFIIHHARSDRPWLNNLLSKVIGKAWKIPALPQFATQLALVAELFKAPPAELPVEPEVTQDLAE
ncbi:hypothetical protein A1359_19850 [Methylomonas lenta]|uniref:Uncharacterized protein n=1 Tax=Methylomonas lenta TaxID=980561 RepID=A0A177NSV4_9GAMM|nr:hypothetical protein [Methylomonas lenta]OAI21126.1 hypothetical protein A1359_19850 [Methylomonas lenta]